MVKQGVCVGAEIQLTPSKLTYNHKKAQHEER